MTEDTPPRSRARGSLFAGGGAATALASMIGASCCVLPLVLVQLGVSSAIVAQLAFFAQAKPYLLVVTALLLLAGAIAAFWGGRRPHPAVIVLLVVGAAFVAGSYLMPFYERDLVDWLRER